MKRQFQPLLLCLFIAFSAISFGSTNSLKTEQKTFDSSLFSTLNNELENFNNSTLEDFSTRLFNKSIQKNNFLNYYSEKSFGGGISLNKEFSYNFIKDSISSRATFSPIYIQSNLFGQGLYYGFAITIVLLNLVCFFIFEEKLFAYFSATVAALTIAFFSAEGLFPLIGFNGIIQSQLLLSTFLLFAVGLSTLFASKYLSIKEFYPKLKNITLPLFGISTLLIIISWINNDPLVASIANSVMFGALSIYFLTGIILFSKKNYAKFYVIGTFVPLLFSIDFFVLKPFGIDFLFTQAIHLKVATIIEVLLLSYAIMYRMQAVKEEGELRQTEMRIFLKRQDVMSRNKVEELVEDVYLENLIMQYDLDGLEIKLLQYISEGKTNTKIARKLKINETELVDLTKELYKKLEISEHIQEDYRMVDSQPDYIYN